MCVPAVITALGPVLSGLGLGGATAAGATAAAGTAAGATAAAGTAAAATAAAGTLSTLGTIVSVGGALASGLQGMNAAKTQEAYLKSQAQTEAQLTATKDTRERAQFAAQIAQQRADLAARGVTLDSPTAIALGQTAAAEMSFQSQATRSDGAARQIELTAQQKYARSQGVSSMLKGVFSAAGGILDKAPDLWPGFFKDSTTSLAGAG
jgi:hypothetical protein